MDIKTQIKKLNDRKDFLLVVTGYISDEMKAKYIDLDNDIDLICYDLELKNLTYRQIAYLSEWDKLSEQINELELKQQEQEEKSKALADKYFHNYKNDLMTARGQKHAFSIMDFVFGVTSYDGFTFDISYVSNSVRFRVDYTTGGYYYVDEECCSYDYDEDEYIPEYVRTSIEKYYYVKKQYYLDYISKMCDEDFNEFILDYYYVEAPFFEFSSLNEHYQELVSYRELKSLEANIYVSNDVEEFCF
jgi:hypothetical protein